MDSLEYIDTYFRGERTEAERRQFEKRILEEPAFAEEVAFYLSAAQAARELESEEKRIRFKEIYEEIRTIPSERKVRKLWPVYSAAAAAVAGVLIGLFMFMQPPSPRQLASRYIAKEFSLLDVKMGRADDLQVGVSLYNSKKYASALGHFEKMIQRNDSVFVATRYAGICCLRLRQYDKALDYFKKLSSAKLFAKPEVLYQALTLLERNKPGDKENAKVLFKTIVEEDLEGKEFAQEVLDNW
jgi:tetratricopeptide (TPR) repeat protein